MLRFPTFNFNRTSSIPLPARPTQEWRQQATWGLILGLATALFTLLLLSNRPGGQSLEHDTLDFWFSLRGPSSPSLQPSEQVAILAVDNDTLRRWNGRVFDAVEVGHLLQLLKQQGAASAVLSWRGLADGSLRGNADSTLPDDFAASGIACLPLSLLPDVANAGAQATSPPADSQDNAGELSPPRLERFSIGRLVNSGTVTPDTDESASAGSTSGAPDAEQHTPGEEATGPPVQTPPTQWLDSAAGAGDISVTLDTDGQVRRMPIAIRRGDRIYPSLALAAALTVARMPDSSGASVPPHIAFVDALGNPASLANAHAMQINQSFVPLLPGGEILLNFPYQAEESHPAAKAGTADNDASGNEADGDGISARNNEPFRIISVAAALDNPDLLHGLRGRCIVIGPTAPAVATVFSTPTGKRISETELHAVVLDNLLSGRTIENVPEVWTWLLTCVLCAITGGFAAARPPLWSAVVVLLCLATAATLSLGLFDQEIWLDISLPWLATGLTFLSCVIGRARRQERESTRIGSTIDALAQVSEIITTQRQPNLAIDLILQWTQDIMRAEGSSILLLDDNKTQLRFVAATGPKADELKPFTLKLGEGIAGWVAKTGKTAIVNDPREDSRFFRRISETINFQTNAILCVPIRAHDEILGVLEVVNRIDSSPFTEDDADLLSAIANQAALVLENARLYDMLSERVVQSESDLAVTNQRLQAEKNTLQTVLQSMTDGVIVCDREEMVRLVNPAAARLLELRPISPGQKLNALLPELAEKEGGESKENSESETGVQLQRGDMDAPRYIEARQTPLQNAEGAQIGTIWVLADITERHGIEQAKSDFVSFVAHEMRSPLTSISGFSSMLQRHELQEIASDAVSAPSGDVPAEGKTPFAEATKTSAKPTPAATRARFLGIIHGESERLTRLINNLLDVARLEAGRGIELNREAFDIRTVIAEVADSQRGYSSRHRLMLDVEPGLAPVFADRDKVAQILINLISNALKYSPGGVVTISARRVTLPIAPGTPGLDAAGETIEIAVRDEGPGIAPEQKPHLFERFGRIASEAQSTHVAGIGGKAKPTGTGLGLFLTRHLVETHGGHIWLDSEPGKGATFRFTLPVSQPARKA